MTREEAELEAAAILAVFANHIDVEDVVSEKRYALIIKTLREHAGPTPETLCEDCGKPTSEPSLSVFSLETGETVGAVCGECALKDFANALTEEGTGSIH